MAISRKKPNPVIEELLHTQEQFHNAMKRLVDVYADISPRLDAEDQTKLAKFLSAYTKLLDNPFKNIKRDAPLEDQVTQLDDVFRGQVRRLEQSYEQCARQYNNFLTFLNEKQIKIVHDAQGIKYDASQQLIKPAQNLMRYKMLVETAMKPTNLGYQRNDDSYKNDPSYQKLSNLAIMLGGDVEMINRRIQGTAAVKKMSSMGINELTDVAKQQRLQRVMKPAQPARVSAQSIFAKPKINKAEPEPTPIPSAPRKK